MTAVSRSTSLQADTNGDVARAATTAATTMGGVDRRSRLPAPEFLHDYVFAQRPVIVTDAIADWPALRTFTWDFFRGRYGHVTKTIRGQRYTLAEAIDRILASTPDEPAPYPFNLNVEAVFPELLRDLGPQLSFGRLDRINHPLVPRFFMRGTEVYELFFGGRGACFPRVHYDALCMNTQITQIIGSKEFFLYPPEQGRFMYPHPEDAKTSQVDFANPDLGRFPLFAQATPIVANVGPGETLFFPMGWWHATRIHKPCLTFGRAQLNGVNWRAYVGDVEAYWRRGRHPWFADVAGTYLRSVGRILDLQERFL